MKRVTLMCFVGACAFFGGAATVTLPPRLGTPVAAQSQPSAGAAAAAAGDVLSISERFEAIAMKVAPAVVAIEATRPARPSAGGNGKGRILEESGSGVLVKGSGKAGYLV